MRKPNATCGKCGEPFYARPSQIKSGGGKFCSIGCYSDAVAIGYPKKRDCEECGGEFTIECARYKKRRFCSQSCSAKHSNKGRVGTRYRQDSNNSFRDRLIERYGKKCFLCGYDKIVHAHHLKMKSKGGSDETENGVLLCPNHHGELHDGLLSQSDKEQLEGLGIGRPTRLESEQS